jgi:hypothetical protein
MTNTETQDIMDEAIKELPMVLNSNELYKTFIGLTNIERVKEEDFVLRELLKGTSKKQIIVALTAKYPEMAFSYIDLEKFIARNQEVVQAMGKEVTLSARRHLQAREKCSEMLAGLAMYTQQLILNFQEDGDNTNTVGAIRALNSTLENYMKLEGMIGTQPEGGKVINVINTISEKKGSLRERVHSVNFAEEKDGKVQ